MKCPSCQAENKKGSKTCRQCGARLPAKRGPRTPAMALAHGVMWAFFAIVTVVVFGFLFYRVYFWIDAWRMGSYYERDGRIAPDVEQIELDSGLVGHAITFYGNDGDQVFIKELRQSYEIVGHLARIELPDSHWFPAKPDDTEQAVVTLTPILFTEGGDQRELPPLELTIDTPESPLRLVNPSKELVTVNTSIFPLEISVVPGSTVLINGEDQTDMVNYLGLLTRNVAVYPVGDNIISLLVSTPSHKETRLDLNLYRPYQEINLEPSLTLDKASNLANMTITGTMDPDAILSVDTPYVEDSIKVDPNGSFKFIAKLETVGDNTVTFRATKAGKQDSVVSVNVYYVPSLDAYSRKAWKMDYKELSLYYDTWVGRVFLCDGVVTEISVDGEEQTVIMDVNLTGEGEPQYVVLTNHSSVGTPEIGTRYKAYADVTGNQFYNSKHCPKLACRYMVKQT